jgi:hypothetical protein
MTEVPDISGPYKRVKVVCANKLQDAKTRKEMARPEMVLL